MSAAKHINVQGMLAVLGWVDAAKHTKVQGMSPAKHTKVWGMSAAL